MTLILHVYFVVCAQSFLAVLVGTRIWRPIPIPLFLSYLIPMGGMGRKTSCRVRFAGSGSGFQPEEARDKCRSFPRGKRRANRGCPEAHGGPWGSRPAGSALFGVRDRQAHLHPRAEERGAACHYRPRNRRNRLRDGLGRGPWTPPWARDCGRNSGGVREVYLLPAQTI